MNRLFAHRIYGCVAIWMIAFASTIDLARAQSTDPASFDRLRAFLHQTENSRLCYSLVARQQNLPENSATTVTNLLFQLEYGKHPSSTDSADTLRAYYFNISARLKGVSELIQGSGECSDRQGRVWCGVECDGGSFFLEFNPDMSTVAMSFGARDPNLRMSQGCDEGFELDLTASGLTARLETVDERLCQTPAQ